MGLEYLCTDLRQHPVKAHTRSRHLFQDPLLTWFVLAPESLRLRGGTLETGAAYQLYPRRTSAKNPHHSQQLSLTFNLSCMGPNLSCMGPKTCPIPLDKYHCIAKKLSSTCFHSPLGRTPRKKGLMRWLVRLSAVACATWLSPLRSVAKRGD